MWLKHHTETCEYGGSYPKLGLIEFACLEAAKREVCVGVETKYFRPFLRWQVLDGLAIDVDVSASRHYIAGLRLRIAMQLVVQRQHALKCICGSS